LEIATRQLISAPNAVASASDNTVVKPYRHIRVEGTRRAIVVYFNRSEFRAVDEIQQLGRELLAAADVAARVDMPLLVNLAALTNMSSAVLSKLVFLGKKAKHHGIALMFCALSPEIAKLFSTVNLDKLFPVIDSEDDLSKGSA